MSSTLGEKLRQAREARGISISEVAEQTRISALYLEAIENNDYRTLPGGIFNKGFVKSYAKYVGIDEKEAMQDYNKLIAEQNEANPEADKPYRPEVLTDEQSRSSSLPTIILAVVILALMAAGVFALLNYFNKDQDAATANANTNKNANVNVQANANVNVTPTPSAPLTGDIKIEFKALNSEVSLTSNSDGKRAANLIQPAQPVTFDLKQSLILSYSKDQASNVQMTINGKQITLPSQPANPKRNAIELNLNKETAAQFYQAGAVTFAPAPGTNTNAAPRP
jgi:cytoskeletal protein RodZ